MKMRVLALVACLLGSAVAAQPVQVPIEDARALARQALIAGELPLALELARKLLEVDPDDRDALIVLAAAAPQTGDATLGRKAGARAWQNSDTDAQKYEAARLTALAAATEERFTLSTFWLRRALTVTPNDTERSRTIADARAVQRRNPWSTNLSFSLAPSSNLNGGATDDELVVNGGSGGGVTLSDDATALAGWRASLNISTQYRLHQNAESQTTIGLQYRANRVRITDDVDVPDEALETNSAEMTMRHIRALENGTISGRFTVGTYDYRALNTDLLTRERTVQFQKYDLVRLGVDRRFAIGTDVSLGLTVQRDMLNYLAAGIGKVDRTSLSSTLIYTLARKDQVSTTLRFTDSNGDNQNYTSQDWSLQGAYSWAKPIGPVSLSVNAGVQWSDYPDYQLLGPVAGGRQDKTFFYGVNFGFPDLEYAGFTPGLSISGSVADSNVSRFERETLSMGLTISSVF